MRLESPAGTDNSGTDHSNSLSVYFYSNELLVLRTDIIVYIYKVHTSCGVQNGLGETSAYRGEYLFKWLLM